MKPKRTEQHFKGILKIETRENNSLRVIFEPVNSTVWLRKSELSSLFLVNTQKINANFDVILKGNMVDEKETCKYDLHVSGSRIRYDVRELRLEAIIAMAFRIDSPHAKVLREWFIERCLKPGLFDFPLDMKQGFPLN